MGAVTVTDATWADEVLGADVPVLVDFWAPWCAPCRQVAPIVEELAVQFKDRVKVAKLNTDENQATTAAYGIISIPTINIYRGGELVRSIVGGRPRQVLAKELEDVLTG
ncbi:thioredoxin [Sanguibacter sp. HDW7]|uniref:thioredoxin n=1 Tax=Sanguibacter sp. HDW7 TaxID=2714931 RepID=UPI00140D71DA|nr:thioredoxin [Sanguibacter sp. HDW7]